MNILRSFSDLVYPRTCELCARPSDRPGRHVCSACLMRVPFAENRPEDFAELAECAFDRAACALRFEGDARQMLLDYKFNRHLWLVEDFVDWLEAAAMTRLDLAAVDCVVPVPMSWWHRYDRGYDQCRLLSRRLADRLGCRYLPRTLRRCGNPARQSSLSERERIENVKGTVALRNGAAVRGRTVLVIDDVLTTGSTISECARILRSAGAWRIWALTLARSVRD